MTVLINTLVYNTAFVFRHGSKVPKSLAVELFTDAEAFDVEFPEGSTSVQKALIAGSAILINANFFESETEQHNDVGPVDIGGAAGFLTALGGS